MTDDNANKKKKESGTEKEQIESRWFLIEHEPKKCGCIIIINVNKFTAAYGKVRGDKKPMLNCPTCLDEIISSIELNTLFESYEKLRNSLGPTSTIIQVQPGYLDTIKDLRKILDKS